MRSIPCALLLLGLSVGIVMAEPVSTKGFPAFPGAEGAGAYTPGGRGGKVFLVTTLADYEPSKEPVVAGSLREAVEAEGPRMVLFRVSGYIELKAPLEITKPYITIAGQTAPGGGICLRNWPLEIRTHDVVVRYLRVRPGDVMKEEMDSIDCSGQNVIFDHCSAAFGIDETLSTNADSGNLTVQWCMITESLNRSVHHKGAHGYGSLISGTNPITYHHNLYAFHRSRNPRPGMCLLDFRNNVIYGWGDWAGYCGNDMLEMNYVGNYLRPARYSRDREYAFRPGGPNPRIFVEGNVFYARPEKAADNALMIRPPDGMTREDVVGEILVKEPFPANTVSTDAARSAYRRVLAEAGASLPCRDVIDARVVGLVRAGKGRIINSQEDVGGWPALKQGVPPPDSDSDGMPDDWEHQHGLNPKDPTDANRDCNGDGFTNVEKYINGLDPEKPFRWIYPPDIWTQEATQWVGPVTVVLTSASGAVEIRYTLDGSEPTRSSRLYSGPFTLTKTTMLRAKAFKGGEESHVTNRLMEVFTFREPAEVPRPVNGLDYAYYENGDWDGFPNLESLQPIKTGIVENVGTGPSRLEAGYGLRFSGFVRVPEDGIYTFYCRSTELSRLVVAGTTLVMTESRKRERCGRIALKAGLHPIELSTYFGTPDEQKTLEVSYEGPGLPKQIIPPSALFRAAAD